MIPEESLYLNIINIMIHLMTRLLGSEPLGPTVGESK